MAKSPLAPAAPYIQAMSRALEKSKDDKQLFNCIVSAPFRHRLITANLGLGFLTFLLVNKETKTIDRIKKTNNRIGKSGSQISVKRFSSIKVPLDDRHNIIAKAIKSGRRIATTDWATILSPDLTPEESRLNQANSGIACCVVYPLKARDGGALIYQYFVTIDTLKKEHYDFMEAYLEIVDKALSLDTKKLT